MAATAFWGDSLTVGFLGGSTNFSTNGLHNAFDGGLSGDTAAQIKTRFITTYPSHRTFDWWNHVIWAGQNHTTEADLVNNVDDIVSYITSTIGHDRFLVVSVINAGMTATDQGPAGARYLEKIGANATMAAAYGNQFLDLHGQLVDYGVSIEDAQSVDYDAPPSTYQPTDIHLTGTGGYQFVGDRIYEKLDSLGFLRRSVLDSQISHASGSA